MSMSQITTIWAKPTIESPHFEPLKHAQTLSLSFSAAMQVDFPWCLTQTTRWLCHKHFSVSFHCQRYYFLCEAATSPPSFALILLYSLKLCVYLTKLSLFYTLSQAHMIPNSEREGRGQRRGRDMNRSSGMWYDSVRNITETDIVRTTFAHKWNFRL